MQALFIFLAILVGILIPSANQLTFLIRYNLMIMLFMAFLYMDFGVGVFKRDHIKIVLLNLFIPVIGFALLFSFDSQLALVAFVISIAPTAAGAPVIATFLEARVAFVTASVLLTNPVTAVAIPFMLPFIVETDVPISIMDVLLPVFSVVFIPLGMSLLIKYRIPVLLSFFGRMRWLPFYLFLLNVFIASAKATDFIMNNQTTSLQTIYWIAILTGIWCMIQFSIGAFLGRHQWKMESSLSLGRKNTMFAIWLSLTFLSPAIALGPMFYILFQNLFNTWQMYDLRRKKAAKATVTMDDVNSVKT